MVYRHRHTMFQSLLILGVTLPICGGPTIPWDDNENPRVGAPRSRGVPTVHKVIYRTWTHRDGVRRGSGHSKKFPAADVAAPR